MGFRSLISFVLFLFYVLDLKINDRNNGETTFLNFFPETHWMASWPFGMCDRNLLPFYSYFLESWLGSISSFLTLVIPLASTFYPCGHMSKRDKTYEISECVCLFAAFFVRNISIWPKVTIWITECDLPRAGERLLEIRILIAGVDKERNKIKFLIL